MKEDLAWMKKPTHRFTPESVRALPEREWLDTVAAMAFPERAATMRMACQMARELGCRNIVETGTIRGWAGDGQSTLILAGLAIRLGRQSSLASIDNSKEHVQHAREWLGELADSVWWYCEDSVIALGGATCKVDFLYLDSYDYDFDNPLPCQLHQLAELGAIYGRLTDKSIILLDDAKLEGGGKVKLSSAFLLERGWKIIMDDYQRLFARG